MGKVGDMVPGKHGVSKGWKKSGAFTSKECVPGSRCMSEKRGNKMGAHERISHEHGTGARGIHHQLVNAEKSLGSKTRTFKKGLPESAPCNYSGSGSHKSRELGK